MTTTRDIIDSANEAFVSMDSTGAIVDWNPAAERIFGWSRDEALGMSLSDTIIPMELRAAHREGLSRFLATGQGPILNRRIQVPAVNRLGDGFPIELTISSAQRGSDWLFHAFIHDISERRRNERYLETQFAVTTLLAESDSIADTLPNLLRILCRGLGWKLGSYWDLDPSDHKLRCMSQWHIDGLPAGDFVTMSQDLVLSGTEGLPGRVAESGEPAWVDDVRSDEGFPRATTAASAGLGAALALPVLYQGETLGVLEFFSDRIQAPDDALIEMMRTVSSQIGQYVVRKRTEHRLLELRALQLNDDILQGLVVAKMALELGEHDDSLRALEATIIAARRIVSELVQDSESGVRTGSFVRHPPK